MHVSAILTIALSSLAAAIPTPVAMTTLAPEKAGDGPAALAKRAQQVGYAHSGYNGDGDWGVPILVTGGCVNWGWRPMKSFYLASGYKGTFYRDEGCQDRIGGQYQAGQSDHLFRTVDFKSYTAW